MSRDGELSVIICTSGSVLVYLPSTRYAKTLIDFFIQHKTATQNRRTKHLFMSEVKFLVIINSLLINCMCNLSFTPTKSQKLP